MTGLGVDELSVAVFPTRLSAAAVGGQLRVAEEAADTMADAVQGRLVRRMVARLRDRVRRCRDLQDYGVCLGFDYVIVGRRNGNNEKTTDGRR